MTNRRGRVLKALGAFALLTAVAVPAWAETLNTPATSDDNGFVVQAPDAGWGVGTPYGSGQAFMVLRETGVRSDQGPDGSVVFRVDRYGALGAQGGIHAACGLRGGVAPGTQQCVWIQPVSDVIGQVINRPATKDYEWFTDGTEIVWKVANSGAAASRREVIARDGQATRVQVGNYYGFAGVGYGTTADTATYRKAAGIVGLANALYFPKVAVAPGALANGVEAYAIDNGAGKVVLKLQFPTGAPVVVGTEP